MSTSFSLLHISYWLIDPFVMKADETVAEVIAMCLLNNPFDVKVHEAVCGSDH